MKSDLTLTQLAQKIETLESQKKDYLVDTRLMEFSSDDNGTGILSFENGDYKINDITEQQICNYTGVPKKYYDRLRADAPNLLDTNVNHWLQHMPAKRMVRTLQNGTDVARAFLSDRYRRIDNNQIMNSVMPELALIPEVKIVSSALTDKNMFVKALLPRIQADVKVGDPVQAGITIRNSEVGHGAVSVGMFIYRLVCDNGMVVPDSSSRTNHVGANVTNIANSLEIYSDEAMLADDKAIMLKVRDLVRHAADELKFKTVVDRMRDAAVSSLMKDPISAVQELGKQYDVTENEQKGIMQHLVAGGDLSAWGLVNAVTRFSQDVESYDRAHEFEVIGGKVLDLKPNQWREIAA